MKTGLLKLTLKALALGLLLLGGAAHAADTARKIAANDLLVIRVLNEPDMTAEKKVSADGKINYFFVGEVAVIGKSPAEVEKVITEVLDKDYIVNPQVSVEVKQYDTQYVTVTGQVNRPGRVEIPADHQIDVIEAIGAAGDFTRLANKSKIELRRSRTNENKRYSLDQLQKLSEQGNRVILEPGDVITVAEGIL